MKESFLKKNIKVTVVNGYCFSIKENGETETSPIKDIVLIGEYTKEESAKKLSGENFAVIINSVVTETRLYKISLDNIVKYGSDITPVKVENEKKEGK